MPIPALMPILFPKTQDDSRESKVIEYWYSTYSYFQASMFATQDICEIKGLERGICVWAV